jgi:alkaline phosphatase
MKVKSVVLNKSIRRVLALSIAAAMICGCSVTDKIQDNEKYDPSFWQPGKAPHIVLNQAVSGESHIDWATENHTASPVPLGCIGPAKYMSELHGLIPNTKIHDVMKEAVDGGLNVILVIGDGMGVNHMMSRVYMNMAENGDSVTTNFERIMNEGQSALVKTNSYGALVTCSAAAATAIACGQKTRINIVGMDKNGYPLESSMSYAHNKGYRTGLVTDCGITDATPAAFYAHNVDRDQETFIAAQLADSASVDVILAGGANCFIPSGQKLKDISEFSDFPDNKNESSQRTDSRNLISEMQSKGYRIINTKSELDGLNTKENKVLGLFASGGMGAAIDREYSDNGEPSLISMAQKDLELLSNSNSKFLTMIECGRIDWESHDNDAGAVYKAVAEMDKVLGKCYDFYKLHKENTLLIFTADHETGGLAIPYVQLRKEGYEKEKLKSGAEWFSNIDPLKFNKFINLKGQKQSVYKIFEEAKTSGQLNELLKVNFGYKVTPDDAEKIFNSIRNYRKEK